MGLSWEKSPGRMAPGLFVFWAALPCTWLGGVSPWSPAALGQLPGPASGPAEMRLFFPRLECLAGMPWVGSAANLRDLSNVVTFPAVSQPLQQWMLSWVVTPGFLEACFYVSPSFGNLSSVSLILLITYYDWDWKAHLGSKLHEDRVWDCSLSCLPSDWHIIAAAQMVIRRNLLICSMVGYSTPPPPIFQRFCQWCFEAESICACEFLHRLCSRSHGEWHAPGASLSLASWLLVPLLDSLANAVGRILLNETAHLLGQTSRWYIVQPSSYPWTWALRGAMLTFPLSGMVIQKALSAE